MKQTVITLVTFFVLLFAYTRFIGPIPFSVSSVITNKTDVFAVSGEGKVTVTPDIALISAGVQAQGATVKAVQNDLNTKINAVADAVKKLGVEKGDIQTTNYSIFPTYAYTGRVQRITGYSASANLSIKVRNIDAVNSVLDAVTEAGANTVGGVSFDALDPTKAENEARQKAVSEAKKKAADAAHIAGFTLGKIINYSEGFGGGRPIPMLAKTAEDISAPGVPTQVEPGTTEVTVTVTLSYEIR